MGFEAERHEGGGDDGSHLAAVFPRDDPGAVFSLGHDEFFLHGFEPAAPGGSLVLVGGQGAVVGVVEIVDVEALLIDQRRGLPGQRTAGGEPQELIAEEAHRVHGGGMPSSSYLGGVAEGAAILAAGELDEKSAGSIEGFLFDRQA